MGGKAGLWRGGLGEEEFQAFLWGTRNQAKIVIVVQKIFPIKL